SEVSRRLVTNHGVHRADDLKEHDTRQAQNHVPRERTHKTVGEIFAEAFNCGAAARSDIHAVSIPPDQTCNRGASPLKITAASRGFHDPCVPQEIMKSKARVCEE